MQLPDLTVPPDSVEMASVDAIALFLQLARAEDPAFTLTEKNTSIVAEVCTRLDGLPLALELAAARIRVLSPEALLARLSDRLRLLTDGARDQPARLQTMRDAIAWSYDLLPPMDQVLFRRMAVFVGDASLEAAEVVAGGGDLDVVAGLASLVDQSLVRRNDQQDSGPRFGMLETIREYGLEQLAASEEEADIRTRHLAYFLEVAERMDRVPYTAAKDVALRRVETELPNMRAALTCASVRAEPEYLMRLAIALRWFWESRGSIAEAGSWLDRALVATTGSPPELGIYRSRLLASAATVNLWRGISLGPEPLLNEALALARASEDSRALLETLLAVGHLAIYREEWDQAEAPLREALAHGRELGEPGREIEALWRLGYLARLRGDIAASDVIFTECLAVARAAGWPSHIGYALESLGTAAREEGDYRRAAGLFAEALALVQDDNEGGSLANCLRSLGAVAANMVAPRKCQAVRGSGGTRRAARLRGTTPSGRARPSRSRHGSGQSAISPDAFAAAWAAGRALPLEEAIAEAFAVAEAVSTGLRTKSAAPAGLTPRELEVLRLLVAGCSDREIGEILYISRRTAANHVSSILGRLDVRSRAAAAAWAVRNGLA